LNRGRAGGRCQSGPVGGVVEAPGLKPGGGRKEKLSMDNLKILTTW